jgi:glycosyl transferase family 25
MTEEIEDCLAVFSKYEFAPVDESVLQLSTQFFSLLKKKGERILYTTNPSYQNDKCEYEWIICYGSYGHHVQNLPTKRGKMIYRHAIYFHDDLDRIHFDDYDYSSSWESISQIYIINLKQRVDRYSDILVELCRVSAPLHRIYHMGGEKNNLTSHSLLNSYLGATQSHLDCALHMKENKYKNVLILEDDFVFQNKEFVDSNFNQFFSVSYDYDVCLISYSKFHEIRPYNDLLCQSFQECTTTSGYLLSLDTVDKVIACFREGFEKMLETGDYHTYVCDRYWAKLQKEGKFFLFRKKMGYQRLTFSDIQNKNNYNFD